MQSLCVPFVQAAWYAAERTAGLHCELPRTCLGQKRFPFSLLQVVANKAETLAAPGRTLAALRKHTELPVRRVFCVRFVDSGWGIATLHIESSLPHAHRVVPPGRQGTA